YPDTCESARPREASEASGGPATRSRFLVLVTEHRGAHARTLTRSSLPLFPVRIVSVPPGVPLLEGAGELHATPHYAGRRPFHGSGHDEDGLVLAKRHGRANGYPRFCAN